ncbi:mediator of RNA polymerase II transcription subunit 14-like isoform X2 [Carex rostrata]
MEVGGETVEFMALVQRVAEESYLSLKELMKKSLKGDELGRKPSYDEMKIDLLRFIDKTRQHLLGLYVTRAADLLFFVHKELQHAAHPIHDIPSAIEVFRTGGYSRLPKCIEDIGIKSTLPEAELKPALKKLSTLVRSKLLDTVIPKEVSNISVSDGIVTLRVDGEFKVLLTLGYRCHLHLWRILHLELLVGEKTGPIKLETSRRYALGDDLERRMAVSENPFNILYTILHELCVMLVMDTIVKQAKILCQGRWRDVIRFNLISDSSQTGEIGGKTMIQLGQDSELQFSGLEIPGLKLTYWLDTENGGREPGSPAPFVRIELGPDRQVRCVHGSFIVDPLTGNKEATLTIDQSCIDVEKLLVRAIACNRHTRLLEIHEELRRNAEICCGPEDVVLLGMRMTLKTTMQMRYLKCVVRATRISP